MKLVLATQNLGKLKEFSELAKDTSLEFITLPKSTTFPKEEGDTFKANALFKAERAFAITGLPTLADDSGLEVDFLGGKHGIHSSRYAEEGTDESNITKLLEEMDGVKEQKRTARFKCCLIFIKDESSAPVEAEGCLEGSVSTKRRGRRGFGYDPVFIIKDLGLHLAEIGKKEKNLISHRAKAFRSISRKIL